MIKAVIFDMDGLLIDSERLWQSAQTTALKTVGITTRKADFQHVLGVGLKRTVEWWYHKHPWRGPSRQGMEKLIREDFLEAFKREGELRPGAHEILRFFKKRRLPMAIASSTAPDIVNMVVETLRIKSYLKIIYSGVHEPHSKPHPGIFITTADRLKVEPRHCLVFEDSPAGVLAAKAARMRCVAVPEAEVRNHPFIQTADAVIDSLEKFDARLLARLERKP